MQPILNIEDVRRVEQALTREGVSISELMHRAGSAAAQEVIRMGDVARAAILVGTGNNGGDGWVAAEELAAAGVKVTVVSPIPPDKIKGDLAKVVAVRAISAGVPVVVGPPRSTLEELFSKADVVLDGMLGTGFRGSPTAPYDIWIDTLNMSGARVVAIDVPSGLSAQTGHAPGGCVFADVTVTMIALKPGLLSDEGRDACGSIVVAPLAEQTARLVLDEDPVAWRAELPDYLRVMAPPTSAVDKYSRGSVLVVAGSS
ncbi:MAG: NAD(P)H-hydrate epimerase, partial [Atopobiaceae bacterium]|nr:NAD(P)H-hydrate epimerase [Atopobiaceae bacterium]